MEVRWGRVGGGNYVRRLYPPHVATSSDPRRLLSGGRGCAPGFSGRQTALTAESDVFSPAAPQAVPEFFSAPSEFDAGELVLRLRHRIDELENQLAENQLHREQQPAPDPTPRSKAAKRRARKKKLEQVLHAGQPGDDGKTRSTGKHKKKYPSKHARKKSTSRTSKMQRQLNATNGKVQKLRRANAALTQQLRGDGSSRGPAASSPPTASQ